MEILLVLSGARGAGVDELRLAIHTRPAATRVLSGRAFAEHLVEVPACREIERHVSARRGRIGRAARRLVHGNEAGQPAQQPMFEGEAENALVCFG